MAEGRGQRAEGFHICHAMCHVPCRMRCFGILLKRGE